MLKAWRMVCVVSGLVLAGCGNSNIVVGDPAALQAESSNPRLQGGDRIRVTVFGEDKLTGDYDIDPGGYVSLPLAGTVKAEGRTKVGLEQELSAKFRSTYLRDPKVTVDIVNYRPFYVMGEVQKPGDYPYKSGLNVLRAVAIAGGQTYRASDSKVIIQRAGQAELVEYPLSQNIPVYPGDLIRLPERYF